MMNSVPKPLVLCILDGWGAGDASSTNAIANADTPYWDAMMGSCAHSLLRTSGLDVGLPDGQMGNSEVGHMNIGSGRIVMQDLPRIDQSIQDGSLAKNPELVSYIDALKQSGGRSHLFGLLSPGGVHSHQDHMVALAKILVESGIEVVLHLFGDGRDTAPQSGRAFWQRFYDGCLAAGIADNVSVGSFSGRYYAMDRDTNWDRMIAAYEAMVAGVGRRVSDMTQLFDEAYAEGLSDEFILPAVMGDYAGVQDGDGLLMANFRADRVRQLLASLVQEDFDGFERSHVASWSAARGMVEYAVSLTPYLPPLFPAISLSHVLGEVIAEAGLTQLRIAETEKYAHVTFFFNGGKEDEFTGENRILIPSPAVATYDQKPSMSATEVTDALVDAITKQAYDVIIVNYANTDMVGHTGSYDAAKQAVECIDGCLGRLREALASVGGAMLITADHGNAEQMYDVDTDQPHTSHTTNPVPLIWLDDEGCVKNVQSLNDGRLSDLAPTMLDILGITLPDEMTGTSLVVR